MAQKFTNFGNPVSTNPTEMALKTAAKSGSSRKEKARQDAADKKLAENTASGKGFEASDFRDGGGYMGKSLSAALKQDNILAERKRKQKAEAEAVVRGKK